MFGENVLSKERESRIDSGIICPFYKTVYRHMIYCEPVAADADRTANVLKTKAARNEYIENFCASYCWESCVIAQMCVKKCEEEAD